MTLYQQRYTEQIEVADAATIIERWEPGAVDVYWTAVINGVVAVPVMTIMMLMTAQPRIMGKFTIGGWLRWLGWASTSAMAACVIGMIVGWFGAG